MNQADLFEPVFPRTAKAGRIARDRGEAATLSAEHDRWVAEYRATLDAWMAELPSGATFNGEHMTEAAWRIGEPHSPACWSANAGTMIRRWMRLGIIEYSSEFLPARKVSSHARRYPAYRKR